MLQSGYKLDGGRKKYKWLIWLNKQFVNDKFRGPFGYIVFPVLGILAAVIATSQGLEGSLYTLGLLMGLPLLVLSAFSLRVGIFLITGLAYLSPVLERALNVNVQGELMLILMGALIAGFIVRSIIFPQQVSFREPVGLIIIIWVGYNILLFFHPERYSGMAWWMAFQLQCVPAGLFFAARYCFNNLRLVVNFTYFIIVLTLIGAGYGFVQAYIGFPTFEMQWINVSGQNYSQYFSNGRLRIFSVFETPDTMGIMMAMGMLISLLLMLDNKNLRKGFLYVLAVVPSGLAWLLAGSRIAFILLPVGLLWAALLSLKPKIGLTLILILVLGIGYVQFNPDNILSARIVSAFIPEQDQEFKESLENQKFIQSYAGRRPFGGGLGTTGQIGRTYSPNTLLTSLKVKDEYRKNLLEGGWLGLGLTMGIIGATIVVAVRGYIYQLNEHIKLYYLIYGSIAMVFLVGNYFFPLLSSQAGSALFFLSAGILTKLKLIGLKEEEKLYKT